MIVLLPWALLLVLVIQLPFFLCQPRIRVHPPGQYKLIIYSEIGDSTEFDRNFVKMLFFAGTIKQQDALFLKKTTIDKPEGKFKHNHFQILETDSEGIIDLKKNLAILRQGKFLPPATKDNFNSIILPGTLPKANLTVNIFPIFDEELIPLNDEWPMRTVKTAWTKFNRLKSDENQNPIYEQSSWPIINSELTKELFYHGEMVDFSSVKFVGEMIGGQGASSSGSRGESQMSVGKEFIRYLLGRKRVGPLNLSDLFFTEAYIVGPHLKGCEEDEFDETVFVRIWGHFNLGLIRSYMKTSEAKQRDRTKECFEKIVSKILTKSKIMQLTRDELAFFNDYIRGERTQNDASSTAGEFFGNLSISSARQKIGNWQVGIGSSSSNPLLEKKNVPLITKGSSETQLPSLSQGLTSGKILADFVLWVQQLRKACAEEKSDWSPEDQANPNLILIDADLSMLEALPQTNEAILREKNECKKRQTMMRTIRSMWHKCEKIEKFKTDPEFWNQSEVKMANWKIKEDKKITDGQRAQLLSCMEKMALLLVGRGENTKLLDSQRCIVEDFLKLESGNIGKIHERLMESVKRFLKICEKEKEISKLENIETELLKIVAAREEDEEMKMAFRDCYEKQKLVEKVDEIRGKGQMMDTGDMEIVIAYFDAFPNSHGSKERELAESIIKNLEQREEKGMLRKKDVEIAAKLLALRRRTYFHYNARVVKNLMNTEALRIWEKKDNLVMRPTNDEKEFIKAYADLEGNFKEYASNRAKDYWNYFRASGSGQ